MKKVEINCYEVTIKFFVNPVIFTAAVGNGEDDQPTAIRKAILNAFSDMDGEWRDLLMNNDISLVTDVVGPVVVTVE